MQLAGGEIKVIAFFGHRDTDDARRNIAHFRQQFFGIFSTAENVNDRTDNLDLFGICTHLCQCVETILRHQRVFHVC